MTLDVKELLDRVERLQVALDRALRRIDELEKENAELRALLSKHSQNSSKPPSSDPSWLKRPKKKGGKKKRGAQRGHKPHKRELLPPERVTKVVEYRPRACAHCCAPLHRQHTVGTPRRHQVWDLPEIQVQVAEHQVFCAHCPRCREKTEAVLPRSIYRNTLGPGLVALASLLSGKYHVSKRGVAEFLRDVLGIPVSVGTLCHRQGEMAQALAVPHEQVLRYLQGQSRLYADETSWKQSRENAWLWVMSDRKAAVFCVDESRGQAVAKRLVGPLYKGVLHSDRYKAYGWLGMSQRQLCWAHLKRNFQGVVDRGGNGRSHGKKLGEIAEALFRKWHRYRAGKLSRKTLKRYMRALRGRFRSLLEQGLHHRAGHVRPLCRELLRCEEALWTFAEQEGVEPTNNQAERDLRKAVLWRKRSFGTDSVSGSRFVERILTACETLRRQGRSAFAFLLELCRAHRAGTTLPSLLPA